MPHILSEAERNGMGAGGTEELLETLFALGQAWELNAHTGDTTWAFRNTCCPRGVLQVNPLGISVSVFVRKLFLVLIF